MAKQTSPRGTEAAKKLQAFYAISDGLKGSDANPAKLTKADLQKAFEELHMDLLMEFFQKPVKYLNFPLRYLFHRYLLMNIKP